jgi:hypothetical protein
MKVKKPIHVSVGNFTECVYQLFLFPHRYRHLVCIQRHVLPSTESARQPLSQFCEIDQIWADGGKCIGTVSAQGSTYTDPVKDI